MSAALIMERPIRIVSIRRKSRWTYPRKTSRPVRSSSQNQTEMKSLLLPAKCSCSASACVAIRFDSLAITNPGSSFEIYREQIDHRENEHPDQINEVPVETADLHVFVLDLFDACRDDAEINRPRKDVE